MKIIKKKYNSILHLVYDSQNNQSQIELSSENYQWFYPAGYLLTKTVTDLYYKKSYYNYYQLDL